MAPSAHRIKIHPLSCPSLCPSDLLVAHTADTDQHPLALLHSRVRVGCFCVGMNCLRPERPDHPSSRGLLLPLFVALGILLLTAASVDLFPKWLAKGKVEVRTVSGLSTRPQLDPRYSGLIDPHNGDNGTDPAQTTTGEAGSYFLPDICGRARDYHVYKSDALHSVVRWVRPTESPVGLFLYPP